MDFFVIQTYNSISYAALLFLLGSGMSLIFGVMKIINVAHGAFYLVGGYIGYVLVRQTGNFYLALLVACLGVAFIGMVIERLLLRGLEGQTLRQMLMTFGIAVLIQDVLQLIFKGYALSLKPPLWCSMSLKLGPYSFYQFRLFMIGAAVVAYIFLWALQEKTRAGAIVRAVVDNREISQGLGINVNLVSQGVAFVVVILGGMGSLKGAAVGALVVGFIDNFAKALFPEVSYFSLFLPMAIILGVRPTGLFGKEATGLSGGGVPERGQGTLRRRKPLISFRLSSRIWLWTALGAATLLLAVLPPILPGYIVILMTQSLIFGIVAMSLDVLIGYTKLPALGHAVYFAIGAYTAAILATRYAAGFAACFLSGVGSTAVASAVFGLLALRAAGVYFLMITLAIAMCIWGLTFQWVDMTGGENGISRIPRPDLGPLVNLLDNVNFHYFILLFFVFCLVFIVLLVRSPFGKTLVGIRDSESRMTVLGYNVWLHKYLAYVIASSFAGVGGVLYLYFNRFVGTDDCSLYRCMEIFLMVSIGGQGTLIGANIGAALITFLKNLVSVYTDRWLMIIAVVYILTARYAPMGIMGYLRRFQK
jgi:branched-chain amino acid transport system permease protein